MNLVDTTDGQALRKAQVEASLKLARTAVIGGIVNAIIVATVLWSSVSHAAIAFWTLLVLGQGLVRILHARRLAKNDYEDLSPSKDGRFIELLASLNGVAWGFSMAIGGFDATPGVFTLLAMLTGGMMGAAVISYGPLPRAAFAYMIPLTIGSIAGWLLSGNPLATTGTLLILCYAAVLSRSIKGTEKVFAEKVAREQALRESAETVQLLLKDYEAQSADWLWSIDREGMILAPTDRFVEASGRDRETLEGHALLSLFDAGHEHERLVEMLRKRQAFRDLTVQITVGDETCWWRLSAQPRAGGRMQGVASDVTAEMRAEARVSYMAHYCGLTDLANRFLFNETLGRAVKRLHEEERTAVLCLDLDQFKSVNDTLGHPIGDRLLCEVARRIEACVQEKAMVARLGGDEFAVLIERVKSPDEVEACAARIIDAVDQPFILDGMQVMTSTSIGIAFATVADSDPTEVMKRADLALYSAKTNGRNRFAHFQIGMDEAARERRDLEMDLRAALVRNEFTLHYQPLVNISSGDVVGYEALIRWQHPTRGLIMPNAFIPLAEETGLIVQVGEWVIRQATAQLALWPADLRISVNLSPAQMRSANLIPTVVNALASAGIDAGRLELEITETVLMQDSEANVSTLYKLREIGVRIALDDFGTGYSSLNYLRSFPFDKIKIDRCFVESLDHNAESRAIIQAITGLAGSLGMDTTAEGVETDAQLQALRDKGCTEIQGFLISQAIDPDGIGQGTRPAAQQGGSDGAPAETQDDDAENRNRAA
ncbi:bifunctional diguanylate cyclase/phosphodiesterase [Novosphingobium sp. MD-1]|uniref:putative bifunctional diguanylate cyclase/phosphodiesterase n=1 Tax=Novosphingobium sp. MD-1 TaxID=1630648 RepID=UPI00130DBE4E|nr:EAL domain-containing protein [Novosphingobium sp. MD-1]